MSQAKKRIAVFFGGRSPEHDVSVITGLQALEAIDRTRYDPFPVYITPNGAWLTGEVLCRRANYMLDKNTRAQTLPVTLDVTAGRQGRLISKKTPLLGAAKIIEFDAALPCFHGLYGEDGNIQGLFEIAGVPYAGMRTMASSLLMDKVAAKHVLKSIGIPVLPCAVIRRPKQGYFIAEGALKKMLDDNAISFPAILKPAHLGSSIGVAKVSDLSQLSACLPGVFEFDDTAIVEPFVPNLVEYNVAVSRIGGSVRISAIERPKATAELLDFKQKYLSGSKKGGSKTPGASSEGMLSLTRELNPPLDETREENIRGWAARMFDALNGTGTPRVDFLGNAETKEIWFNEVNPWPGSTAYFLWEAAAEPLLFTELLTGLIEEAFEEARQRFLPQDPVPVGARLLKRPLS